MWRAGSGSSGSAVTMDDAIHVRIMGALAVGKTTIVSTAVTRTAQKRSMPYSRSRNTQRFICSVKTPGGDNVVAELIDTKGNETLENVLAESRPQSSDDNGSEKQSLLVKEDRKYPWCYLVVFDYTRHETYVHAKRLIERIRQVETVQAMHSSSRSRRANRAVIFLLGNKREMCAAATLSAWIRDQQKFADASEHFCFLFSGSALENSFECSEVPWTEKVSFIEQALGVVAGTRDDLAHHRLSMEQILYLFKVKLDMELGTGDFAVASTVFGFPQDTHDEDPESRDPSSMPSSRSMSGGNDDDCCARCCRCFGRRARVKQ